MSNNGSQHIDLLESGRKSSLQRVGLTWRVVPGVANVGTHGVRKGGFICMCENVMVCWLDEVGEKLEKLEMPEMLEMLQMLEMLDDLKAKMLKN